MEGNFAAILLVHQESKYTILENMRSGRRSETESPKVRLEVKTTLKGENLRNYHKLC